MTTRVVLIPGLMGSALMDSSRSLTEHQRLCAEHWDSMPRLRDYLKNKENTLCGEDSDLIWGRFQFFHWVADLKGWVDEMVRGDGYRDPKMVRPGGLTEVEIKRGERPPYIYKPYASLVRELKNQKADVLLFSFDWRLTVNANVAKLQDEILKRWWSGRAPTKPVPEKERLLLIGHSLGGLVARLFIEHPGFLGAKLARHAILVATPNKGSPNAFAYVTKTKRFFQDVPLWQVIEFFQSLRRDPKAKESVEALTFDPLLYSPEMLSEHEDHRLVECFASIIQLFPTFDFVHPLGDAKGKTKQKYAETYGTRRHSHTKKLELEILNELDGPLLDGWSLDAWLTRHDIIYDLVGAIKLNTNVEMEKIPNKSGYKLIPKKAGDGTVPSFSSLGWAERDKGLISIMKPKKITNRSTDKYDDKNDKDSQKEKKKDYRVHAELCRHSEVIKLCTDRFKKAKRNKPPDSRRLGRGSYEQYEAVAKEIFLKKKPPFAELDRNRTKVICYALVNGVDDKKMLIDIATKEENGQVRLANPPKGVAIPANVFEGSKGRIKYRFVELAHVSHTPSGILFLPEKGEGFLHLFCIIAKSWDECNNLGHAEMQFHHWLEAQRYEREWQGKIVSIFLWNESLTGDFRYSPCARCCDELAAQWLPKSCKFRRIHWRTRFVTRRCQNSTTKESLQKMKDAGWLVHGPDPI